MRADRIGGRFTVESANGGVEASNVHSTASVRSSFGSIALDGIEGGIDVNNQNGAVEVSGVGGKSGGAAGCHDIIVRTSFSPIRVHLPANGGYRVNARTSSGHVMSDFPITVSGVLGNDSLTGTIGDGKCELRLSNSNSTIEILKSTK